MADQKLTALGVITFIGTVSNRVMWLRTVSGAITFSGHVIRGWKLPRKIRAIFEMHKTSDGGIEVK